MIDEIEALEMEALEQRFVEEGLSYDTVRRLFGKFLLGLFDNGTFSSIFEERTPNLVPYLKKAVACRKIDRRDPAIIKLMHELWVLHDQQCGPNADLSNLARCVIVCYGTQEEWEEGDSTEPTAVYLYLVYLKKVIPGIRPLLIEFFTKD